MKNLFYPLLLSILFINSGISQNTYDTYAAGSCNTPPEIGPSISPLTFTGEYQIFLKSQNSADDHYWKNPIFANNLISYKIEAVSFPFTTNCMNCQGPFLNSPFSDRKLKMPDSNFPYNPLLKSWVRNFIGIDTTTPCSSTNVFDFKLMREYRGGYGLSIVTASSGQNHFSTLVSRTFSLEGCDESHPQRVIYPHTILKHTMYMHCGNQITDPIVDSFSFVLDHTRGKMSYYPFTVDNFTNGDETERDITICPRFELPLEYFDPSAPNSLNTPNYYPLAYNPAFCSNHIPQNFSSANSPENYIRPAPFSLLKTFLGNSKGDLSPGYTNGSNPLPNGIKHQYIIDRTIDLTLINPSERIIYNPSDVNIDLNQPYNTTIASKTLIFPTGYTFKTVQGTYPSITAAAAADPFNLYYDKTKIPFTNLTCDDVGPTNDNIFSYYRVKNGSILHIQSCVAIHDVKILVEDGGIVVFDNRSSVAGNYQCVLDPDGAGYGVIIDQNTPVSGSCAFDCYDITKYDVSNINITANETWINISPYDSDNDGILRIAGTLRIATGKTLTINGGIHFEFGENGKIIVERGAKFIINSHPSNLTTMKSIDICQKSMWQGIEVWGNKNVWQGSLSSTVQGVLKFTNVKISDARNAIITEKENDLNYTGGIVQCQNVLFENNERDAEFNSYHNISPTTLTENKNLSYFKNCQFKTTRLLKDPKYIAAGGRALAGTAHIYMWDVKYITIEGCTFENSATNSSGLPLFDADLRSIGILAMDVWLNVPAANPSTFKGLSDGVWSINTGDTKHIAIEGNSFVNNTHAITIEGNRLSKINKNIIEIPAHDINSEMPPESGYNKPYGLYLIGATDFTVEENEFKNFGTPSTVPDPQKYNYGMIVNNCANIISNFSGFGYSYKNKFSNLNISFQSELDNRGTSFPAAPGGEGLTYKCNEFNNRITYDVAITGLNNANLGAIRDQGYCDFFDQKTPAGNQFNTLPCSISDANQIHAGDYLDLTPGNEPNYSGHNSTNTYPQCYGFINLLPQCLQNFTTSACPSNFSNCLSIPCLATTYQGAFANSKQMQTDYYQLLDGGDTDYLLNKIYNITTPVGQLKNLLMSKSPYLSDTVMIAYLNCPVATAPGTIKQVLLANAPLTTKVMNAVYNRMPSLSPGIVNQIEQAQTAGVSARKLKEMEVDYAIFQSNLQEAFLKQAYLEVDNLDSLKKVAEKDSTLNGLFKLMEVLLTKGDLAAAQTCRTKIVSKEMPHISDRCKFLSLKLNLALQGKTWFDMDSTQQALVQQIYDNNPETAIYARAVLALTKGLRYEHYPYDITATRNHLSGAEKDNYIPENLNTLKVYPNPSTSYTNIEVYLSESKQGQLSIYNVLGEEVFKQHVKDQDVIIFETDKYANGIYMITLSTANGKVEKQKLMITK